MLDAEPWIRRFPARVSPTTAWTVLFFPHSGASAGSYQRLAGHLSDTAATACVHYPGRAERRAEPLFTDLHLLADDVADAFTRARAEGPVLLFGHSMGAALAYEVVTRTADQRQVILAVSGHPAPCRLRLPDLSTPAAAAELIRSLGGGDTDLLDHPFLRQVFLPVIQADLVAHSRYRPKPGSTVHCPTIALMGTTDPLTTEPDMRAWEHHTTADLRLHTLPGGHFFTDQHTTKVAEILRSAMSPGLVRTPPDDL
ncbi:thioesterase II family protein [Actinokineospora iranica]|uniref:Surfactin synthase thioesterase subunit n=1 Tax=Actinokineospora iranica TaxID=1271860 RepID=A0A1G6ILT4_9PSEU|nr:alpha/beta fold hydrolase [Actinokineospora iranica]SDC07458.1 Surfactin synthase thioesterase subunit [Actinokineospora iranica]